MATALLSRFQVRLGGWRTRWATSLRWRWGLVSLTPLLLALPVLVLLLAWVGGHGAQQLVQTQLHGGLASTRNYLDVVQSETRLRVSELVKSERLNQLVLAQAPRAELDQALRAVARGSGLDYVLVLHADGRVLGSSSGVAEGQRVPNSYVMRQARVGVSASAYERVEHHELAAYTPQLLHRARVGPTPGAPGHRTTPGLLINAGAHFPLAINLPDVVLMGGLLLNGNTALIEHMREVVFPVGTLLDGTEGLSTLYLDDVRINASRQKLQGQRRLGQIAPPEVLATTTTPGALWLGRQTHDNGTYLMGYAALFDGDGQRIGLVGAGFPLAPYQRLMAGLLVSLGALMGLTLLGVALLFWRTGRDVVQRVARIDQAVMAARQGQRDQRLGSGDNSPGDQTGEAGHGARHDDIDQLARHFDQLLDTLQREAAQQQQTQQALADEASLWHTLFEHERDGVVILNPDGSVFDANPKAAAMLGCTPGQLRALHVTDWDARMSPVTLLGLLHTVGPEGHFFETTHRRRDGSLYEAEVSISRVVWGPRTFVLTLVRDITERKTAQAELAGRTQALRRSEARARAFLHTALDAVLVIDAQYGVLEFNLAAEQLFGWRSADIHGQPLQELLAPPPHAPQRGVAPLRHGHQESWGKARSGRVFPLELSVGSLDDAYQPLRVVIARDLSERKLAEAALQRMAHIDELTQVLNRRGWMEHLQPLLAHARRYQHPIALLSIDADHFKRLNDTYGHPGGDAILRALAHTLQANLREVDVLGRMGGEEFAIALPETSIEGAQTVAQRLLHAIRHSTVQYEDHEIRFTVSIGASVLQVGELDSLPQALKRADAALYQAKRQGRDQLCLA